MKKRKMTKRQFLSRFKKLWNVAKGSFNKTTVLTGLENGECPFLCRDCNKITLTIDCPLKKYRSGTPACPKWDWAYQYTESYRAMSDFFNPYNKSLLSAMIKIVKETK